MPTIELTSEQLAYVQALREEIEDEVPYGQVRNLDAVQYLIDHHREDGDLDIEIEGDLDAEPEGSTDGGTTVDQDPTAEGAESGPDAEPDEGTKATESADGDDGDAPTPDPGSVAAGGDDDSTTRISGGPDPSQLSGGSGDDTLNEMMNLLEAHEDVWEEASSGDTKYQVELPDGDVEGAATKDDVRALLFKHYR